MDLSYITQSDYYAGLFKSNPKITLHLSAGSTTVSGPGTTEDSEPGFESWECGVCAYRNPPGLSPAAARICALCGVPRSSIPAIASSVSSQHLSSSLPSSTIPSRSSSVSLGARPRNRDNQQSTVACPACTFLNHPSLRSCEMCSTPLPTFQTSQGRLGMKSAPSSRPASPDIDEDDDDASTTRTVRLSFRKGGDKAFYALLKRTLKSKSWEVRLFFFCLFDLFITFFEGPWDWKQTQSW